MEKPVRITVAIPVYNTEKYLERCLDSVQGQTFRDLEILCIDDGSTDRSPEILRQRAASDDRIRVIILPGNRGIPHARNLAIDEACGEYLYYMDSDDWLDPDYLEAMYGQAQRTGQDVVINRNWIWEYDDTAKRHRCGSYGFDRDGSGWFPPYLVQSYFFPVVWARLYRLQYLKDHGIRSPQLPGGVEDNCFTALAEVLQPRSYIFDGPDYHYYQRADSISHGNGDSYYYLPVFRIMTDSFRERNVPPDAAKRFYCLDRLKIDGREMFDQAHAFFSDVEAEALAAATLYYPYELFVMKVLASCPDYRSFRRRYFPSMKMNWRVRVILNRRWPSVEDVVSGKWKV